MSRIPYQQMAEEFERVLLSRGFTHEDAWQAAEQGCIGICWSNTMPNMPA